MLGGMKLLQDRGDLLRSVIEMILCLLARGFAIDKAREMAQDAWLRLMEQQRLGKLVSRPARASTEESAE